MKKFIISMLIVVLIISLCSCSGSNKKILEAELGSTVLEKDMEITVNKNIINATQLNGDEDQWNEFLTTDMTNYGDTVLCDVTLVSKDGYSMYVIEYTVKNIGKKEQTFESNIKLDYNNGYIYDKVEQYWTNVSDRTDDWNKFSSIEISPLNEIRCKVRFNVPKEVTANTKAPLKLILANHEYSLR